MIDKELIEDEIVIYHEELQKVLYQHPLYKVLYYLITARRPDHSYITDVTPYGYTSVDVYFLGCIVIMVKDWHPAPSYPSSDREITLLKLRLSRCI